MPNIFKSKDEEQKQEIIEGNAELQRNFEKEEEENG